MKPCTCGHGKTAHFKDRCHADGCDCRQFSGPFARTVSKEPEPQTPPREPEMGDRRLDNDRKYSWSEAAEEARAQIAWHERRIKVLQGCHRQFAQFHKENWPFPGDDRPAAKGQR